MCVSFVGPLDAFHPQRPVSSQSCTLWAILALNNRHSAISFDNVTPTTARYRQQDHLPERIISFASQKHEVPENFLSHSSLSHEYARLSITH